MRSMTAPGAPGRCQSCMMLVDYCVCELVGTPYQSRPQVVIVRHHWEALKSTGTARLASLALSNLRMIDMAPENPAPVRALLSELEDAWLLYPGGSTSSPDLAGQPERSRPHSLVVLDGTWRQTRKMLRRLPELSRFPRYSLSSSEETPERDRLRAPPRAGARSTLESIADALGALDSPECGQRLLHLHRCFVERTRRARGQLLPPMSDLSVKLP